MLRNYFKNSGIIITTQTILQLKNLIFLPFLTRHFGALNYGVWSQIGILLPLIAPVIILSTDSAIGRHLSGHPYDRQRRWFTAWLIFLVGVWCGIGGALLLMSKYVAVAMFGSSTPYQSYMPLVTGMLLVTILLNSQRIWFQVQNNGLMFSTIDVMQAVFGTVVLIIVLWYNLSIYDYVFFSIVGDAVLFGLFFIYQTFHNVWATPDFSILPKLLRFGLPLIPISYAGWGLNSMDRLFLVHYATLSHIGIYSLAYSIGYFIIPICMRPFRLMYPTTTASLYNTGKADHIQSLFDHAAGTGLALAIPAAVGMIILSEDMLAIFATREFVSGAPVLGFIAFGYIFHVMASFFSIHLGLVHKQALTTLAAFIAVAINLLLNFLLIPSFGILGAAIATAIAFFIQMLATYFFSRADKIVSIDYLFIGKIVTASAIMGLCVHLTGLVLVGMVQHSLLMLALQILTGIFIYSMLLFIFKVIGNRQLQSVRLMFVGHQA